MYKDDQLLIANDTGVQKNAPAFPSSLKAGLSLEAALTVPLFMIFMISMISFLVILFLQVNIQSAMEEVSRSIGKKAYILDRATESGESTEGFSGEELTLMSVGINPSVMKIWLLGNNNLRNVVDRSRIIGGSGGLYTYNSSFDENSGMLDLVVNYDYSVPGIPKNIGTLRLLQRSFSHVWTGRRLSGRKGGSESADTDTVYVTPNGSVYHTSKSCKYLDLSIHTSDSSSVASQRNANGSRYERCTGCTAKGYSGTVYITDYGTNWHSSLSCSGLKRTVIETSKDAVHDMRSCPKCGGH